MILTKQQKKHSKKNCIDFYGDFLILFFEKNSLYIYSDPFGKFPVYYYIDDYGLHLLKDKNYNLNSHTDIDTDFIYQYTHTGNHFINRTALNSLKLFPPGFKHKFTTEGNLCSEYITDKLMSKSSKRSAYMTLNKAISNKIECTDKIVLELSGGVESTCIAAILSTYKESKNIRFVSYYDKRSRSSNESIHARKVARYFNIDLYEVDLAHHLPFSPFSEKIPNHVLPCSSSCFIQQQRYITSLYDDDSLFINGHGGDSIFLAPSPSGIFTETLFKKNIRHAARHFTV